ncbi:MAG: hypothetical protein M3Y78_02515 [Pseudomonadota bacterium]|nr:hypothetical protein [Pseudomonadota bacterium]
MISKFRTAALSALIGLGALAAMPAAAQAEGLYLNYGHGGIGIHIGDHDRVDYRKRHRHHRQHFRACTSHRALDKAERYGVRRARVVDVDRRTITVSGRKHGHRARMVFSRAPNCPVVRW